MGVAAGFRNNMLMPSGARVRLDGDGMVTVETDMTDIGTGSYTIIAQTAAEMMGVPLDRVTVRLGDSDFPVVGLGRAVRRQQLDVGRLCRLRQAARGGGAASSASTPATRVRRRRGASRQPHVALADAARRARSSAEDTIEYGDLDKTYQQSTFAAHFVEVGVDAYTGEVRVRRMLAVCAPAASSTRRRRAAR